MSSKITLYLHEEEKKTNEPAWPENLWHIYDDVEGVFLDQSGRFAVHSTEAGLTFLQPEILDKIAGLHKMRAFRHQKSAAEEALTDEPKNPEPPATIQCDYRDLENNAGPHTEIEPSPSSLQYTLEYKARIATELEKIIAFINSSSFPGLPPSRRQLFVTQRRIMFDLSDILGERIATHREGF